MWRVARIELQLIEHRPAEHVRQENIERDGRGVILPGEGNASSAFGGDDALEPLVARQAQGDAGVVRVVLDDEQHGVARLDVVAVVLDVFFARDRQDGERRALGIAAWRFAGTCASSGPVIVQRQVKGEGAALAMDAGELDLAAEQHRQFAADGQPEAGAAVFAGRAGVGLLEGLENESLLLRRDADAGVLDREGDHLVERR